MVFDPLNMIFEILQRLNGQVSDNREAYIELAKFTDYLYNLIKRNQDLNLGQIADLIRY